MQMIKVVCQSLAEYNQRQVREMLGPENRYFTGLMVGHPPSDAECAKHYVERGGSEGFRQRHVINDASGANLGN